jgi:hypothetical protein
MSATTINLPQSFQMPSAAALMNQPAPATSRVQPTASPIQQPMSNQPLPQQLPATYPPALPPNTTQPGLTRRLPSTQPSINMAGAAPTTQLPFNPSFGIAAAQSPFPQQPQPQTAQQQQFGTQPMLPQQGPQQFTAQPQQLAPQLPMQPGATATLSHPAPAQYLH